MVLGISGLGDKSGMMLGHLDGVILIGFFAGYIVYMVQIALKANREGKKSKLKAVPTRISSCFPFRRVSCSSSVEQSPLQSAEM